MKAQFFQQGVLIFTAPNFRERGGTRPKITTPYIGGRPSVHDGQMSTRTVILTVPHAVIIDESKTPHEIEIEGESRKKVQIMGINRSPAGQVVELDIPHNQ